jgi:hypothetical protein
MTLAATSRRFPPQIVFTTVHAVRRSVNSAPNPLSEAL